MYTGVLSTRFPIDCGWMNYVEFTIECDQTKGKRALAVATLGIALVWCVVLLLGSSREVILHVICVLDPQSILE